MVHSVETVGDMVPWDMAHLDLHHQTCRNLEKTCTHRALYRKYDDHYLEEAWHIFDGHSLSEQSLASQKAVHWYNIQEKHHYLFKIKQYRYASELKT